MTALPPTNSHFPAGAWWREKLRALGDFLKRAEPDKPQKPHKEKP